ncbi:DedA family protein [Humibacillus xanthopallidus]|uniref:Membrane protein DedA with SNARE-associated domain n=1 Tax=Humibacillus xanthopallidus TaxID=412689 RepID=A0A543HA26_9MICO|nr:DedA family protein [Humibacillus xanthopallidus]TQM55160.1 membrane protein DedA with SNARE-associated domain [Humibacillus xanthopallidus]
MSGLIDTVTREVLNAPMWLVLLVVGGIVFLEDAVFVGFVVPGETVALLGGVTASLGHVPFPVVLVVVVVAAIVGDSVGFEVGRHLGGRVVQLRAFARHRARIAQAQDFLGRRGGSAVFLGRWTAFLRAVMPALAGMSRMHYPTFLAWNAAGGIAWGSVVVTAGYLAGRSCARVETWLGRGAGIAVAVIAVVALVVWQVRRHRADAEDVHDARREPASERSPIA